MYDTMSTYRSNLFDQLDHLHRQLAGAFGVEGPSGGIRAVAAGSYPAVNVGRTPTTIEVWAYAPGLDPAALDVTVDRGVLRLSGERPSALPKAGDRVQVYTSERPTGRFARAITLPDDADPAKVEATYRDGILRVSVGLRETARPQRIAVQ